MSIKDIKPGKPIARDGYFEFTDHSHVLPPVLRSSYVLRGRYNPRYGNFRISAYDKTNNWVGYVDGTMNKKSGNFRIEDSSLDREHKGKGLGSAMYESAIAHAFHKMGAKKVVGDTHSTNAHHVHEQLSKKHGLNYKTGLGYCNSSSTGDYDSAYGPYSYDLK